ncbi:DNA polymerase III subunit epsilon [Marinobacter lutaoensis]|uniref:DNA polymerase III subunit epsilon n=1 Tax=Marinobacter lutaoensis TaxID=135739 RepID=A0A1V2DQ62_9GAMM|nr:3'-5' exonuclease [Marinobacter lutaoensis]ONF42546.1 DNA polymerase III subunit epsilon [Marinobacter lutaoensis]
MAFPLGRIEEIQKKPDNFRLLERVPWTQEGVSFPYDVSAPVGDEVPVLFLDHETTGFDHENDAIIELGMVKALVSPSTGQVATLISVTSLYNDPGFPIPEVITDITGITDAMVSGQTIETDDILDWFSDDPIVVAHNASFDRPFFDEQFPALDRLRWACSQQDVPWREMGFESAKLEYLLLKRGYFYDGHRAATDCLALAFLLTNVNKASRALFANESKVQYQVKAWGSPFNCKDALKSRGYRWAPEEKVWHTMVKEDDLRDELEALSLLYSSGGERAEIIKLTSRDRYR